MSIHLFLCNLSSEKSDILNNIFNDREYMFLVKDILDNEKFETLKNNKHHGLTRYDHSLRVSYYSYKITKFLKLNYNETARAGLLHDFFDNDDLQTREQKLSAFYHPKKALENSEILYKLSDREKNIIISHMFPLIPQKVPKYLESWLVSLVDKIVATYEFGYAYGPILSHKLVETYMISLIILKSL